MLRDSHLELRSVAKSFAGTVAVHDVSMSISKGEFVTLLGQSGSGKTTTLMMIAGFVEPSRGSIELDGRDLVGVPAYRRSIGVVFQSYALFPHMTVEENVSFPLRMRDLATPDIARKVGRILDLVQLQHLKQRKPSQLSGGQQQRVALARALVFEPSLLLLDEPLGALDRMLREEMKLELRRVHRELGTTMIYVTHDQDEALVLSDRVVIMSEGRIEQIGTPEDVYSRPRNGFVARFVGESNFISGRVSAVKNSIAWVHAGAMEIRGLPSEPLQPGEEVRVFIRPERISLERPTAPQTGLRGVVEDQLYGGEVVRYHLDTPAGRIVVKQTNRHGSFLPSPGETVALSWTPEDAVVFPAQSRSDADPKSEEVKSHALRQH